MAKILLIDDESLVRQVMALGLQKVGHEVLEAADGNEGLKLFELEKESLDLVITDIFMPRTDGMELIADLRKRAPSMPLLAISGGSRDGANLLGVSKSLGARSTLAKPFTLTELREAVDGLLTS